MASRRLRSQRAPIASELARSSRSSASKSRLVWKLGITRLLVLYGLHVGLQAASRAKADQDRDQVQQERQEQEHHDRAVQKRLGAIDVGRLGRQHVHVVAEVHELIVQMGRE